MITSVKPLPLAVVSLAGAWAVAGSLTAQEKGQAKPDGKAADEISAALMQEKASRTEAQRKMESPIILAIKKARGEPPFDKHPSIPVALLVPADGRVLVDLDATVTEELLDHIKSGGGEVVSSFPALRAIRAKIPLLKLDPLARRADVRAIAAAAEPVANLSGNHSPGAGKGQTGGKSGESTALQR